MSFVSEAQRRWFFAKLREGGEILNGEARAMGFDNPMPGLTQGQRAAGAAWRSGTDAQAAQAMGENIDRANGRQMEKEYQEMWAQQEAQDMDELAARYGFGYMSSREG